MKLLILFFALFSLRAYANAGIGYSGRLVQADGSPVTGTADLLFELSYSGTHTPIQCSQEVNSVPLTNGVYSVVLNFDSGGGACNLANVLSSIPGGETLDIQVKTLAAPGGATVLTFNYQNILNSPRAYFADNVADGSITLAKLSTTDGTPTAGDVIKFDGTNWGFQPDGGGGGGALSSLGGLTDATQTFAIGTTGTAPAFSSATATHTLNIPMANAAGVTAGLVSKTQFDSFVTDARTVSAGTGLSGGGDLSANRTLSVDVGTSNGNIAQVGAGDKLAASIIPSAENLATACGGGQKLISNGVGGFSCGAQTVTAGTGLNGGGALTANITLNVDTGTTTGKIPVIGAGNRLPSSIIPTDSTMLPLAGGTMTGAIAMGTSRITGLGTPAAGTDAATKDYVDAAAPDIDPMKTKTAGTYNRDNHSLEALRERIDVLETNLGTLSTNVGNLDTDVAAVQTSVNGISASSGSFSWVVATADATLAAGNAYAISGSSILTFTLPATCSAGESLKVVSGGDKGYQVFANSGQSILYNGNIGGVVISGYATVTFTCVVDDTTWLIQNVEGTATVTKVSSGSGSTTVTWWGSNGNDLMNGDWMGTTGQIDSHNTEGYCLMINTDFYCIDQYNQYNSNYQAYKVTGITSPQQVVFGYGHTCVLETSGGVKCFGYNAFGQLGDGSTSSSWSATAVQVTGLTSGVNKIAASQYSTCADHNNEIKCWGRGSSNQLGNSSTANSPTPVTVSQMSNTGSIYLGYLGTGVPIDYLFPIDSSAYCAIKDGSRIYCWGSSSLGGGTAYSYPRYIRDIGFTPEKILVNNNFNYFYLHDKDTGEFDLYRRGNATKYDSTLPASLDIISTAGSTAYLLNTGYYTMCIVLSNNTMHCAGSDSRGQQLNGSSLSNYTSASPAQRATDIVKVYSEGRESYCYINTSKDLFCWGYNINSRIGIGALAESHSAVFVASNVEEAHLFNSNGYARTEGSVLTWGTYTDGTFELPIGYVSPAGGTSRAVDAYISSTEPAYGVTSGGLMRMNQSSWGAVCTVLNNEVMCHAHTSDTGQIPLGTSYYLPFLRKLGLEP